MKKEAAYRETIALTIVALLLLCSAALQLLFDPLHIAIRHDMWAKRTGVLCSVIACYGAVALSPPYSAIGRWGRRARLSCARGLPHAGCRCRGKGDVGLDVGQGEASRICRMDRHIHCIWRIVRSYFLAQPMRYDEAFTFNSFVNMGVQYLFFYPVPNNHVLHTLLVRLSVALFGGSPVAIRLPAFVAGVLVVPLTFTVSRLLVRNACSGFIAAGICATYPYLVLYDTMARGYSLLVLLSLCLVIQGYRLMEHPSSSVCALFSLIVALGLFDMPSFLFPAAGVCLWCFAMLLSRGFKARWILIRVGLPFALVTAGLTGVFYTPVVIVSNGIQTIIANKFVENLAWSEFVRAVPMHLAHTISQFSRDVPVILLFTAWSCAGLGCFVLATQKLWVSIALLPSLVIGAAIVFLLKHAVPFDRTWIYLLPFIFVVVEAGIGSLATSIRFNIRSPSVILAGCAGLLVMCHNTICSYDDTGAFPEAPVVVDVLSRQMNADDAVVVIAPADAPVEYYMWLRNIPRSRGLLKPKAARTFFIVKKSRFSIKDLKVHNPRKLLDFDDAELYVSEDERDLPAPRKTSEPPSGGPA